MRNQQKSLISSGLQRADALPLWVVRSGALVVMVLSEALLREACPVETDVFCHFFMVISSSRMAQESLAVQGVEARPWQWVPTAGGWFMASLEKKKRLCIYGLF